MKNIIILLFVLPLQSFDPEKENTEPEPDYVEYHQNIIKAEELIFIDKNEEAGLSLFQKTFEAYEFVFVDDCIEAFQLALIYEDEAKTLFFIKKH